MRSPNRIKKELLRMCEDTDNGAKLSRFQDWAAMRSPDEVEYARHFLSTHGPKMAEDRRKDPRFPVDAPITIRNFTQRSDRHPGILQDISFRGVLIRTRARFALNDAVEVCVQDTVVLGEIIHFRRDGQESLVGISLSHTLNQQDLERVMKQFAGCF